MKWHANPSIHGSRPIASCFSDSVDSGEPHSSETSKVVDTPWHDKQRLAFDVKDLTDTNEKRRPARPDARSRHVRGAVWEIIGSVEVKILLLVLQKRIFLNSSRERTDLAFQAILPA